MTVKLSVLTSRPKLLPYVIFQRKTIPKENLLVGLIYWFWMTNEFMIDWIKVVWNQRPGKHGTLVLDDFNLLISGGMTSQLQVLDAVINKPFKVHLQQLSTMIGS
jgi:hypothetical protein